MRKLALALALAAAAVSTSAFAKTKVVVRHHYVPVVSSPFWGWGFWGPDYYGDCYRVADKRTYDTYTNRFVNKGKVFCD